MIINNIGADFVELKKFIATNMAEAMIKVKNELGSDAIILQTRRVKRGGFLGIGSKVYIEVTAMNEDKQNVPKPSQSRMTIANESSLQLKNELSDIKLALKSVNEKLSSVRRSGNFPEPFEHIHTKLIESGLSFSEATSIVEKTSQSMTPLEARDDEKISRALKMHFYGMVKTQRVAFSVPQKIIFVGPTGVGKTTTLAKIAAMLRIKEKLPLSILTLDTYRIAAAQQLKTYADIMHIPFKVIYTPQEAEEVSSSTNESLILMDTAGRSQKDAMKIEEISAYVRAIKPEMVFLTIDATKKRSDVEDVISHFMSIAPTHIIITKIDETSSLLGIMTSLANSKIPLSFVTNGQNVPEDIMYADELDISTLIVKEVLDK